MDNFDPNNTINPLLMGASLPQGITAAQDTKFDAGTAKQRVLDKIASGESHNYNTIYGGQQFDSYGQHPNISVPIGNTGKFSTAAGRYQMINSTWQSEAKKLGLKDFSPDNQDAAAWDLAQSTYKQKTGRDLLSDAQNNVVNYSALGDQWTSLKNPQVGAAGGSTPSNLGNVGGPVQQTPSPVQQPDSSALLQLAQMQALAPQHKFTPVDYDPFKIYANMRGNQ